MRSSQQFLLTAIHSLRYKKLDQGSKIALQAQHRFFIFLYPSNSHSKYLQYTWLGSVR